MDETGGNIIMSKTWEDGVIRNSTQEETQAMSEFSGGRTNWMENN